MLISIIIIKFNIKFGVQFAELKKNYIQVLFIHRINNQTKWKLDHKIE